MTALVQRVKHASVTVDGECVSEIGKGFLVLFGVFENDTEKEADLLADKTAKLRIFTDEISLIFPFSFKVPQTPARLPPRSLMYPFLSSSVCA